MLASKEISLVLIYHPELCFLSKTISDKHYLDYFSNFLIALYEYSGAETYSTPIMLFPQLILLAYLGAVFSSFYFSYFSNPFKEGHMVDADYLTSNATAEAEKEISSLDDMILGLLVIIYIFG